MDLKVEALVIDIKWVKSIFIKPIKLGTITITKAIDLDKVYKENCSGYIITILYGGVMSYIVKIK